MLEMLGLLLIGALCTMMVQDPGTGDAPGDPGEPVGDTPADGGEPVVAGSPDVQDPAEPAPGADLESLTDEQIAQLPPGVQQLARDLKSDYTKKTQGISEERKQLTERAAGYDWHDRLVESARSEDPFEREEAKRMLSEALDTLGGPDDSKAQPQGLPGGMTPEQLREHYQSLDPATQAMLDYQGRIASMLFQRVETLERNSKAAMDTFASREVVAERARLQGEHGEISDEVWGQVLQTADKLGIQDLGAAWKIVDYENAGQRARKDTYESIQRKQKAGPRTQTTTPGTDTRKGKTLDEIMALADQEVKARGPR